MRIQPKVELEFPEVEPGRLDQHEEWCRVKVEGQWQQIRFHDYARIYEIPGLYEGLFYERLECTSPTTVANLLAQELRRAGEDPSTCRALDVGAGNGMVGEALRDIGITNVVGTDLLEEARRACLRDRPGLYADYVAADLTALSDAERASLQQHRPNVLTTVAALGFNDIPHRAFINAWNLVETPAWIAFNVKDAFLSETYEFGFSLLIRRLLDTGLLKSEVQHRYLHRRSVAGAPLHYVAIIGRKTGPVPESWLSDLDEPSATSA